MTSAGDETMAANRNSNGDYTFTVFTPTYNRAHTLPRVYDSLKAQTFRDFEWLVIDDGSTDDTRDLVYRWRQEAAFPIRYVYQENQGKHVAHNRAVVEARGAFFLTIDSDDGCLPEALARLKYHWDSIPVNERGRFSSVTCLGMDTEGRIVGTRFPQDVTDSDSLECHFRYKVRGDKWGFHRTAVLRAFPMPGPEFGKSYLPEGLTWWKIARHYKTRFVNEQLLTIHRSEPESNSKPRHPRTRAPGAELCHRSVLTSYMDYLRYAPLEFLRSAVLFVRYASHLGHSPLTQLRGLNNWPARALWMVALPVGAALYLYDQWNT